MAFESGNDDRPDVPSSFLEHVVATSQPESPEDTVRRLFGEHDPEASKTAQGLIADLMGEGVDREGPAGVGATVAAGLADRTPTEGPTREDGGDCGASEDLRSDGETRHEIVVGDRVEYAHCLDGALIAAELTEDRPVTVRSTDPITGEPVIFEVGDGGRSVTPDDAVASVGMAEDVPDSEDLVSIGIVLARGDSDGAAVAESPLDVLCRNFNAFESVETYEEWALLAESISIAVPAAVFATEIGRLVSGPAFD